MPNASPATMDVCGYPDSKKIAFYAGLEEHFPSESIVHVDGEGSVERVAQSVLALVEPRLAARG